MKHNYKQANCVWYKTSILFFVGILLFTPFVFSQDYDGEVPASVNDHVLLGTGYDSVKKKFRNVQVIDGDIVSTYGYVGATFEYGTDIGFENILKKLNGGIEVGVNFPVVRASAGATLAKESASSERSQSFTFYAYLRPKDRTIEATGGLTLNTAGDDIATNYQSERYDMAGDQFVKSIEYGADVFINMKVDYRSAQDKLDIGGKLDVDFMSGMVNAEGELKYLDEDLKKSVKINVKAYQHGGDPKQLLTIIPNNIATCTLKNPDPCFELFDAAIDYARNNFAGQFNSFSDYNVVKYYTQTYKDNTLDVARLSETVGDPSTFTTTRLPLWEAKFLEALLDEKRASGLLSGYYSLMDATQRGTVENIKKWAYDNSFTYADLIKYCNDNPFGSSCETYWNTIDTQGYIKSYDRSDLEITGGDDPTKYFQCEDARQHAMNHGYVSATDGQAYLDINWAPIFYDYSKTSLGIAEWTYCKFAVETYGTSFTP